MLFKYLRHIFSALLVPDGGWEGRWILQRLIRSSVLYKIWHLWVLS